VTGRRRGGQLLKGLALLGASTPWVASCPAGEPGSNVPGVNGPEIMLYFAQPIGPSAPARFYGLRIAQHSLPSMLPGATSNANDLAGRRELVNLRMAAHENLRIDFGRRVSWDFKRREFNVPANMSINPILLHASLVGYGRTTVALP